MPDHTPRLLVLGGMGRLGRLLQAAWPGQCELNVNWHGRKSGHPAFDILKNVTDLEAAITNHDVIALLAGSTPASPSADLGLNIELVKKVLTHIADKPLIYASSAAVYGALDRPGHETDKVRPVSDYGCEKMMCETIISERSGTSCILRIGNVIGADTLFAEHRDHYHLDQFDDGRFPVRSYLGPDLLANVLCHIANALHNNETLPDIINVAGPRPVSMAELLDAAQLNWTPRRARPEAIQRSILDVTRLETLFPLDPAISDPKHLVDEWRRLTTSR